MANSGKNSNTSQFFFTLKELPQVYLPCFYAAHLLSYMATELIYVKAFWTLQLSGKHVVFGEVMEGMDVIEQVVHVFFIKPARILYISEHCV